MKGYVIWLTGLSNAGKTTVARALHQQVPQLILLDGDELRTCMDAHTSAYDRAARLRLAYVYARFARMLALQSHPVCCATIAMFDEVRAWNRENITNYFEVFLDVPLEVLRTRDTRGIYDGTACTTGAGSSPVAGVDILPEFPNNPDLRLCYPDNLDTPRCVRAIRSLIQARQGT